MKDSGAASFAFKKNKLLFDLEDIYSPVEDCLYLSCKLPT